MQERMADMLESEMLEFLVDGLLSAQAVAELQPEISSFVMPFYLNTYTLAARHWPTAAFYSVDGAIVGKTISWIIPFPNPDLSEKVAQALRPSQGLKGKVPYPSVEQQYFTLEEAA